VSNIPLGEFRSKYEWSLPEYLSGEEFLAGWREHLDPFTAIRAELLYPVRAALRYAIEESHRVHTVQALLEASASNRSYESFRRIGQILCESHAAYAECGLGSPGCDELVQRALAAGFPGAKMTGGGAGGVVAILGRQEDEQAIYELAAEYEAGRNAVPHIFGGRPNAADTLSVQRLIHP
jgi:L-arabinokinase